MAGVGDRSAHNMAAPGVSSTFAPPVTVAGAVPLPRCDGIVDFSDYSLPLLAVALVGLVIGLIYAFFGYRFFKTVLFLTGLLFGAGIIYLVCEKERVLPTLGNAGVALIAGTLFGLITMLIEYVGLFMTGFLTGQLVGAAVLLCLHAFALVNTVWITIAVQFVAGLVLAQVMLVFQRIAMIAGTALIGGGLVMASMDYFGQRLASILYVWDVMNIRAAPVTAVCWYSWAMIALWPLVFVVAAAVQFRFTAVGYSHKSGYRLSSKGGHRGSTQRLTVSDDGRRRTVATHKDLQSIRVKENRAPTPEPETPYQPKSFRLLYQARRTQGDVICQV